ncbi:MAG: B12-binding domain-containing radical SAM protein [Verrucomicrobia bacterium]|nr:B12-binding domain-containing radical SAM protein [Verrucomicrobiota bacterium]
MMTSITLIRVPELIPTTSNALTTPPVGLAYLASYARSKGCRVRIIDALGEALHQYTPWDSRKGLVLHGLTCEQIIARCMDAGVPRVIGVSNMFSQDWPLTRTLVAIIKKRLPDSIIILGGEHITATAEFCLKHFGPHCYCIGGEGEVTLVELLEALEHQKDVHAVEGISYLNAAGLYTQTGPGKRIKNIDDLPYPAWDLVPLEAYLSSGSGFGVNKGRNMPIVATRGCPYACSFCSNQQMWLQRWIFRDPKRVVDEMEHWIKTYRVNNFDFYDLTAIVRKKWIIEFCKEVVDRSLNVMWQLPSGTRSEALDEEVVAWMKKAGCCHVVYAPESGSPTTLKRIRKMVDLGHLSASMRAAVKQGMFVKMNIVLGFPGDTVGDVLRTYWFLFKCALLGVHDVFIYTFTPYPGSALFRQLREEGKIDGTSDAYFYELATYTKVNEAISYTDFLTSRQLSAFKFLGMMYYYCLVFLFHPLYLFRMAGNLWRGATDTRVEGMVHSLLRPSQKHFRGLVFAQKLFGKFR